MSTVVDPALTQMAITSMVVAIVLIVLNFVDRILERREPTNANSKPK